MDYHSERRIKMRELLNKWEDVINDKEKGSDRKFTDKQRIDLAKKLEEKHPQLADKIKRKKEKKEKREKEKRNEK
jgi:hypothetical protein